ncbi:ABC transporter substrate-binding protein (plasmid) [Deinococcus sp. KNUC1210]|uniref:ABC transporter substrate-binding protein n=1 Tax=Deinococcus sp. KNUC1210 TaxID=2917691 RepID=UPI001EF00ADE|nr:ABC transporter substrate-binding protein [Deinococcus sp. KNUC1210]ULH13981.1 ABC transporter substrate-binding protein [Deinococcus sp. KNUC1210]
MKGAQKETTAPADVPFWYLKWRLALEPQPEQDVLILPLSSLADAWSCTTRQVRRRLADLQQRGLVEYRPGQGRGHLTNIRFTTSLRDQVLRQTRKLAEHDQTTALIRLINLPMTPELRWEASGEVRQMLGWQQLPSGQDVFRSIWRGDLPPIDPRYCFLTFTAHVVGQLGDTLLRSDAATGEVLAHLAHHHETPDRGLTWRLHLRKGVRFHHGRELWAQDVVETFTRFQASDANYRFLLEDMCAVSAADRYTVQIELRTPNLFFPTFLTNVALVILPHDLPFDEHTWVASGPFRLIHRTAEHLHFRANDAYFLGRPLLDEVEILLLPTAGTGRLSLYKGAGEPGDVEYRELEQGVTYLMATGRDGGPLHDRNLRRAVAGLFDLERMAADLSRERDLLLPATGFLPHRSVGAAKSRVDIQALLHASDYAGQALKLLYLGKKNFRHFQEAAWIQAEALNAGITVEIDHWPFADVFAQTGPTAGADLILCNESFSSDPHLSFIAALKDTNLAFRQGLPAHVLNHIDDQLRAIQAQDGTGRERLMGELEAWLTQEGWVTFLYHRVTVFYHSPQLQGVNLKSFGEADWRTLWFRPEGMRMV